MIKLGIQETLGGHKAIVARLTNAYGKWILRGAIEEKSNGVLYVTFWSLSGESLGLRDPSFNLVRA